MSKVRIRVATSKDGAAILEIYKWYIENTAVTFETEVPPVEEFERRIENTLVRFPWLVCEIDGVVSGVSGNLEATGILYRFCRCNYTKS
ncbi:MAG: GNAT family N-acetyltransferase [Lachnospiraceae bacterium]|nr:GNAT family N-acetyltransferase [Lachnospiraceae bacterium]